MYQFCTAAILTLALTAPAFAADEMRTVVECQSIHAGPDFGLGVTIETGGIAGMTFATVSEETIAGPRTLGHLIVRSEQHGMMTTYAGTDFSLEIIREVLPHQQGDGLSGKLVADLHGQRVSEDMNCKFVKQSPITCMAYWSGFAFDSDAGHCVKKGASGCANPFQFLTLESCQQANEMHVL